MLINYAVETSLFLHVLEQLTTLGGNEDISPHYSRVKPGFHFVVSVVSVVRKKIIGQIEFILSRTARVVTVVSVVLSICTGGFHKAWFPYRCICRICRICRTKKNS